MLLFWKRIFLSLTTNKTNNNYCVNIITHQKKKTKTLIEIFEISGVRRFESVGPPAAPPELTITTSQGANVTHLEHRRREIVAKNARILVVLTDDGVGGATVEKHLVGMEETSLADEVPWSNCCRKQTV